MYRSLHPLVKWILYLQIAVSQVDALIPATPMEQTSRAIKSIRDVIDQRIASKTPRRLYIDYLIPLPPETVAADIDPWPGGLAQMYPYAEKIITDVLSGVVEDPGNLSSQILSPQDCCGFFVQESKASPERDVAAILFPSVDQLEKIDEIDRMVGKDRTLLIFNRQFKRPEDFGFRKKDRSQQVVFDRFEWGFAFQEFACRGEDVKLNFELGHGGWKSCVICDEDVDAGAKEFALLEPSFDRPVYEDLERRINKVLPEPLWMRKMGEAETKGLKFQRGKK